MFEWFKKLFKKEQWETLGSFQFFYQNADPPHDIVNRITAVFYISENDGRKVEFMYNKKLAEEQYAFPENHPFYHSIIVPFLKKIGQFDDYHRAKATVKQMCRPKSPDAGMMLKRIEDFLNEDTTEKEKFSFDKSKSKSDGNIIKVDFDKPK